MITYELYYLSGEDSSSNTDCGSSTEDDTETDAPSVSASEVNGTKDDLETVRFVRIKYRVIILRLVEIRLLH